MLLVLALAHFIADYPLQSDWMVKNKHRRRVVALHSLVHLACMLALTAPGGLRYWYVLLAVAGVHFGLDMGKLRLGQRLPGRVAGPYLADQALHLLVLWGAAAWMQTVDPTARPWLEPALAAILLGFVLVAWVWGISERVLFLGQRNYQQAAAPSFRGRMLARQYLFACLMTLFFAHDWLQALILIFFLGLFVVVDLFRRPGQLALYAHPHYNRQAVLTDLAVVAVTAAIIVWIAGGRAI